MRATHLDLIQAHARLVRELQADGYRGHLMQIFRFSLEEPIEVDKSDVFGSELRRKWSSDIEMSKAAQSEWEILSDGSTKRCFRTMQRAGFCGDHAIPLSITAREILSHVDDRDKLSRLMEDGLRIVMITREEDRLLSKSGLRSSMPEGWTWGDSPYARYNQVGIELAKVVKP